MLAPVLCETETAKLAGRTIIVIIMIVKEVIKQKLAASRDCSTHDQFLSFSLYKMQDVRAFLWGWSYGRELQRGLPNSEAPGYWALSGVPGNFPRNDQQQSLSCGEVLQQWAVHSWCTTETHSCTSSWQPLSYRGHL